MYLLPDNVWCTNLLMVKVKRSAVEHQALTGCAVGSMLDVLQLHPGQRLARR